MFYEVEDTRRIRGDIKFFFDNYADVYFAENLQDFLAPDDLETAILISIGTDAKATEGEIEGNEDVLGRRGSWMDTLLGINIGSKFWLLKHLNKQSDVLTKLSAYMKEALGWMKQFAGVTAIETEVGVVRRSYYFIQTTLKFKHKSSVRFVVYYDHYHGELKGE